MIFKHERIPGFQPAWRAGSLLYGRRRGIALVMALVVMATLTVILALIAKEIVGQRLAIEQRHRRLQAQWLARAGVEIAAARLLENPDAFTVDANDLVPDASVHIITERVGNSEYSIAAESQVGSESNKPTAWSTQARFRRSTTDGAVRVINVGLAATQVQLPPP